MPMHMTGIETLRGNARALGTFACGLSAIAGGVQGGNQNRGPAFVGEDLA
jgi:hypothetical protein